MEAWLENRLKETEPEIRRWFRHLHENPELGFEEYETAAFVADKLKAFGGIKVRRLGETGVLGIIETGREGPVLSFRADMDALPICEEPWHEVCSKKTGIMHACGHDGHTATLLGAAKILVSEKERLCGEIRLVFQPSEERQPGGAKTMVAEGALDGVEAIFGLHYSIDEAVGCFSIQDGANFAANYKFDITVAGKEGHAAFPHLAKDAVLCGAELVCALGRMTGRGADPCEAVVLSVTSIEGGSSYNSLPGTVRLKGTLRFLNPSLRETLLRQIDTIGKGICAANGCEFFWNWEEGCGPLVNERELTEQIEKISGATFGKEKVSGHPPVMGCEDFSEYLKKTRGVYYRVGARTEEADGTVFPTHNSGYRLNEAALYYGAASIVSVVTELAGWDA